MAIASITTKQNFRRQQLTADQPHRGFITHVVPSQATSRSVNDHRTARAFKPDRIRQARARHCSNEAQTTAPSKSRSRRSLRRDRRLARNFKKRRSGAISSMKNGTEVFNTTKTQTVQDAIAFSKYLRSLNPDYDRTFENFLKTQDPSALLNSEQVDLNWINYLINEIEYD